MSKSVVQVQGILQIQLVCLHSLLGLRIIEPDSACKEFNANTPSIFQSCCVSSWPPLAAWSAAFHVCFLGPDNTGSEHLIDVFRLGLLPPLAFNHLLSLQGYRIRGLVSPLSVFSASRIINMFSAKYSNLFRVRCLAVLETQEPLGEPKAQEDKSDLEFLKTRP